MCKCIQNHGDFIDDGIDSECVNESTKENRLEIKRESKLKLKAMAYRDNV